MEIPIKRPEKIKLKEINPYLTCYLCRGYLIDATTISECLHSFCRSCIIRFLQENSFCPVCEVIINKAKPNLKLDKTLQDIVYKLVPELFLKEMTRRKKFYQQHPQVATRLSPEERGEDIERTIFNPQDFISLSMEYVSDDSTPRAIWSLKNGLDKNKNLTAEENQALMKRYLQCPGMCRVEVLKKFVRNKYNVDTNLFYIDVLYKRVPLPDHYTLIDIAYIYSWKRNEPMKFFFRIIDINKASERFDMLSTSQVPEFPIKTPTRAPRSNGDRVGSSKKRSESKRVPKTNKQPSHENASECDKANKAKIEARVSQPVESYSLKSDIVDNKCDNSEDNKEDNDKKENSVVNSDNENKVEKKSVKSVEKPKLVKDPPEVKTNDKKSEAKSPVKTKNENRAQSNDNLLLKSEIAEQIKNKIQNEKGDNKNSVYTNITLNRTNNVEIITKIQKVSNKEGQPIGLNIIKQTVKKGTKTRGSSPVSKVAKKVAADKKKQETAVKADKQIVITNKSDSSPINNKVVGNATVEGNSQTANNLEEEKYKFFKSIELTAKNVVQNIISKQNEVAIPSVSGQKRKNSSPVKNDKAKKPKVEKPTTKIIIQPKPPTNQSKLILSNTSAQPPDQKRNSGLQSLIDSCKINIPSSLSITLKESSDSRLPALAPPAKNYIEILKLPDDNTAETIVDNKLEAIKILESTPKICDNDSEQKVDQDLSEIAKSLTEKIPMSTTVSQIVGPKPQFPIPVKSNAPSKFQIQPSPVPEMSCKVLNMPKDNKLSPRSPQTFQKIFEESIKRPDGTSKSPEKDSQKAALDLTNEPSNATANHKRNILEIASQLYKKTKLEQEKSHTESMPEEPPNAVPKVPIPRLPNQRKPPQSKHAYPKTFANLHSNALGLNYTIAVGPNVPTKINGVVSPAKKEPEVKTVHELPTTPASFVPPKEPRSSSPRPNSIPRNMSPGLGYNSPRNSPKHSPKSSPMVKHMYAPTPNLMDQLRVYTFNQKVPSPMANNFAKQPSPKMPSPSSKSLSSSPKLPSPSPKLPSPSQKLSIPSPKLPSLSPKMSASSPKLSPSNTSPKPSLPQPSSSVKPPKNSNSPASSASSSSKSLPKPNQGGGNASPLSPNQILEKYNIQNLAQLTASLNFNSGNFGLNPGNQLAALQHAMLLKHFEMQNRQNWLNMNQGPLLQYEKYLQSLKNNQNHLLGNIKEN